MKGTPWKGKRTDNIFKEILKSAKNGEFVKAKVTPPLMTKDIMPSAKSAKTGSSKKVDDTMKSDLALEKITTSKVYNIFDALKEKERVEAKDPKEGPLWWPKRNQLDRVNISYVMLLGKANC